MLVFLQLVGVLALIGIIRRMETMANNFEQTNAALDRVAAGIEAIVAEIRNPATDNNDQEVIDSITGRLENMATALEEGRALEAAEDAGPAPEPEPEPTPEEPVE